MSDRQFNNNNNSRVDNSNQQQHNQQQNQHTSIPLQVRSFGRTTTTTNNQNDESIVCKLNRHKTIPIITIDQNRVEQLKDDCNDGLISCNSTKNMPLSIIQPVVVTYRSIGIGLFGATMRYIGMPLEKIALYINSSQVSGNNQLQQAIQLTFKDGIVSPYKVVGFASISAWFMQYSIMGIAFQFFDQSLSKLMNVRPMYYGVELMEPPPPPIHTTERTDMYGNFKYTIKTILSPVLAACLESCVSNRAEVQRFYGPDNFKLLQQQLMKTATSASASSSLSSSTTANRLYIQSQVAIAQTVGPALVPNVMRNIIMCQTSFLLTPLTYKYYFPQEHKNKTTLFWFGLSLNIFIGNVVAITQQSLWGRTLDHIRIQNNYNISNVKYTTIISQSIQSDGYSAFFTIPKWSCRVLMNAPAQGTLPWFYNEILPLGESYFVTTFQNLIYNPFLQQYNNNNNTTSFQLSSVTTPTTTATSATQIRPTTTTEDNNF